MLSIKFPFLESYMTWSCKHPNLLSIFAFWWMMWPAYISYQISFFGKFSKNAYVSHQKFPILVSYMTYLHKHQSPCNFCFSWVTWPAYIIHQNSLFWYFHIWQVTWPLPPTRFPYPQFLPNWETLLNQATSSSPPKKVFKQSKQKSRPLWWIQQTLRSGPQNSEIFSRKY